MGLIVSRLVVVVLLIAVSLSAVTNINNLVIAGDSMNNLRSSFHLAKYKTISQGAIDDRGVLKPSNLREPLPTALGALWIYLNPALKEVETVQGFQKGQVLELLKLQNIIYLFLLFIGVFLLTCQVLRGICSWPARYLMGLLAVFASFYCLTLFYLNTLLTEFQAAGLILWFTWAWLVALQKESKLYSALAGVLLGLLMLTKAAVIYIGAAVLLFFFIWLLCARAHKQFLMQHIVMALLVIVTVMPWYIRNYIHFNSWEFTQRGPVVLLTRAYENAIVDHMFAGAFYAYAPYPLKPLLSSLTGNQESDRFSGGLLEPLNRFPIGDVQKREAGDEEGAISYYIKATTHFKNTHEAYHQKVHDKTQARLAADRVTKKEAFEIIFADPLNHLKASLVFAWRGMWPSNTVDGRWSASVSDFLKPTMLKTIVPFLGLISMFALFVCGVVKQSKEMVAFTILGAGTFSFYSLLTHFIPRYSEMFIPIWIVALMYVLSIGLSKFKGSAKRSIFIVLTYNAGSLVVS